jgi:hypothetical protein
MAGGDTTAVTGTRARRLASRFYVLATTYLVARLLINRVLRGIWGFDTELVAQTLGVALLQLGVLAAETWLTERTRRRAAQANHPPGQTS